jgi:hypothetical protein
MEVKGLVLHLQHRWYGPHWFLSDGTHLDREVAETIIKDRRVASVGDALFADTPGQTWRFAGSDF